MTTFTGRPFEISQALAEALAINSQGDQIPTDAHLHEKFMPSSISPELLKAVQEYRNDFTAGIGHRSVEVMRNHFEQNPGQSQVQMTVPFGMDTFEVVGTNHNGQQHFVTAYKTNGGEPMGALYEHLGALGANIAKS